MKDIMEYVIEDINEMYEIEDIEAEIERVGRIDPDGVEPVILSEDEVKAIKDRVDKYMTDRYGKRYSDLDGKSISYFDGSYLDGQN